ncbi:MAG: response regulator [Opitutaceae bacterium]
MNQPATRKRPRARLAAAPGDEARPILYVEDREDDAFFMIRACAMAGIRQPLQAVPNGNQAIAYLDGSGTFANRRRYPLPCLMLLDLHMPGTSGFEVLAWIRSRPEFAELPVLVFTSSKLPSDAERAARLGASGFLVKPLTLKELVEMVNGLKQYWPQFDPGAHRPPGGVAVS